MKQLIIATLLLSTACGEQRPTAQQEAETRRIQGEQHTALYQEMVRQVRENTTVICINGTQYMAWLDIGSTVRVHGYVPLFEENDRRFTKRCEGGITRQMDNPN